jgi:hypothetical protein
MEHGCRFGTKWFVNRKITYKTSSVFSWSKKEVRTWGM